MSRFLRTFSVARSVIARRSYASEAASSSGKLRLNFTLPHQAILKDFEAIQVNIQSTEGDMGILADHVPTIAQLNLGGLVEVIAADNKPRKYFVSGGFAIINPDSTLNINAVEAFDIEQIDVEAARRGSEEAARKLNAAGTSEADKVTARVEQELYDSILLAVKA
ncbi:hypothetical protein BCR33DRAFT_713894 [Rhizoclosmatium globosum]|uniref:ATP synthase subunit delta, mitochondrial n=1 Tax=Rhizoclosmatium globosum TaxID=329046 RepID=A0A1Y2CRC0_9FUNG|nr:delta subunit of the central stalk of mitochondrial F1F0 ATP synthase, atp16 [Rhizoclosmatium hyalinum]KAJ3285438.1 delta subunit of the central stalk of mitochondrial F1F0 ATP synthase, atp16 [Rhizoclosmatium sp. JEL0117]ORY49579.1 hypothetical protein BCR33DRAFT_713894 [Rhizoclosmatium globosum]|eukprot:ORY49579.1 hypothetical protein BCR33DRAFT_713894 [Rhizoclosmatium globosum]